MTLPHRPDLQVTESGTTDLILRRTFSAPASLVYAAHIQPELLRRWQGARGWKLTICEVDPRPEGHWRFFFTGPENTDMEIYGVFKELVPTVRLVQTQNHRGWTEGNALVTTDLEEIDSKTLMTVRMQYSSPEIRDQVVRSPMKRGAGYGYDRLDSLLATLSPNKKGTFNV